MADITSLSDLVNRMTGGASGAPETIWFTKNDRQAGTITALPGVAAKMFSLWRYDGSPSGGVAPGAVAIPTNATAGGMQQTDASGGRTKYLVQFALADAGSSGSWMLYDRLLHISGLSGTVTTPQTVGGTLTRYTGGVGNQIFVEIYTQIGASATTITASYTNQAGTSGRTTTAVAFGAANNRENNRFIMLPLQAGDTGVQSVQTVTVLATTGTAGNFGVTLAHPLAYAENYLSQSGQYRDLAACFPGPVEIKAGACLALAYVTRSVALTAPEPFGALHFVEA